VCALLRIWPLSAKWEIILRDGGLELKGSHMGYGRIFLKTPCDVSFNKVLWNEPTFSLLHLAGQYFKSFILVKKMMIFREESLYGSGAMS
jgi:hypothetical protein